MKIAAFILALIILFLSTQCLMLVCNSDTEECVSKEVSCSGEKACTKLDVAEEPEDEEEPCDEEKGVCNPFMSCSGCYYVVAPFTAFTFAAITISPVIKGYQQDFYISAFVSSTWHPPNVV